MSTSIRFRPRQSGFSMIGLMFIISLVVIFMKVGFTLGPIYWNHYKAMNVIKQVVADPATVTRGPEEVRNKLQRFWDIEDISHFQPKDIKVKKTNSGRALAIDYEVVEPLFKEISFQVHFVEEIALPGGSE